MGDKPYTTTSVLVSPSQLAKGQLVNPAREGPGRFFSTPDVPSNAEVVAPGHSGTVLLRFWASDDLRQLVTDARFEMREGQRVVGTGQVVEIER